jgi:hypothetical protein
MHLVMLGRLGAKPLNNSTSIKTDGDLARQNCRSLMEPEMSSRDHKSSPLVPNLRQLK